MAKTTNTNAVPRNQGETQTGINLMTKQILENDKYFKHLKIYPYRSRKELREWIKALSTNEYIDTIEIDLGNLIGRKSKRYAHILSILSSGRIKTVIFWVVGHRDAFLLDLILRSNIENIEELVIRRPVSGHPISFNVAQRGFQGLSSNTTIKLLDIGTNRICDSTIRFIVERLANNCTLRDFDVRFCGLESASAASSISTLLRHNRSITGLRLQGNKFCHTGMQEILGSMHSNNAVKTLNLSRTNLGRCHAELRSMLKNNRTLEDLDLSQNDLGRDGLRALDVTTQNEKLKVLDLSSNRIGVTGSWYIGEMLVNYPNLEILDLRNNAFNAGCLGTIACAIKDTHISELLLDYNEFGPDNIGYLRDLFKHRTLKKLSMSHCGFNSGVGSDQNVIRSLANTGIERLDLTYNDIGFDCIAPMMWALVPRFGDSMRCLRIFQGNYEFYTDTQLKSFVDCISRSTANGAQIAKASGLPFYSEHYCV